MVANVEWMVSTEGITPWHGIGTVLPQEFITAEEALRYARLDWEVSIQPYIINGQQSQKVRAIIREDTQRELGAVGMSYQPIQNHECFDFMDAVVGEKGAHYQTAGILGNGEKIWMQVRIPGHIEVRGIDTLKKYLLLHTSHDGSGALYVRYTPIRVVCQNTLNYGIQRSERAVSVRHTSNYEKKVSAAREILGIADEFYDLLNQEMEQLATESLVDNEAWNCLNELIPENPDAKNKSRTHNMKQTIMDLYQGAGAGLDQNGIRGTKYAFIQAITEYVDWHRGTRTRKGISEIEGRLTSAWFGSGAKLKEKAYDLVRQWS